MESLRTRSTHLAKKFNIEQNFNYTRRYRKKDALLLGLYHHATYSKKLFEGYKTFVDSAIQRLEIFIIRGNYEKKWKVKHPCDVARTLHGLLVGEVIKLIVDPKEEEIEKKIQRVQKAAQALLR